MKPPASSPHNRSVLVSALGITQILAWGSSYYLPAVLAGPIAVDTGWSLTAVVAGLSCGLLLAGIASPTTGRLIQQYGGRPVLVASSLLLASALALMAMSDDYLVYLLAWLLMGLGMSSGLYDAGFATLGRLYGPGARGAITTLTLFGGFASTVCWPLSAFLVESYGWRTACMAYAAIHLLICLPLHALLIPKLASVEVPRSHDPSPVLTTVANIRNRFALLAAILTIAALISSTLSVHLIAVLELRGLDLAVAVALGALIGPSQVAARVVDLVVGRNRHHPIWTMLASVALLAAGIGLLIVSLPLTALALILYGAGNGIHTIARGALPLIIFDPKEYAAVMGKLGMPSLLVQALAPSLGAMLLAHGETSMLAVLFAFAVLNVGLVVVLARTLR